MVFFLTHTGWHFSFFFTFTGTFLRFRFLSESFFNKSRRHTIYILHYTLTWIRGDVILFQFIRKRLILWFHFNRSSDNLETVSLNPIYPIGGESDKVFSTITCFVIFSIAILEFEVCGKDRIAAFIERVAMEPLRPDWTQLGVFQRNKRRRSIDWNWLVPFKSH